MAFISSFVLLFSMTVVLRYLELLGLQPVCETGTCVFDYKNITVHAQSKIKTRIQFLIGFKGKTKFKYLFGYRSQVEGRLL